MYRNVTWKSTFKLGGEGIMKTRLDLIERQFGDLFVEELEGYDSSGHTLWRCSCDCGDSRIVEGYRLLDGSVKNCGCSKEKSNGITPALFVCSCRSCPNNMLKQIFNSKVIPVINEYVKEAGACMCEITPEEERAGIPGMRRGATHDEIAEIYGVCYNAVWETEEKALKRIRKKIEFLPLTERKKL
jgi:hypothetical protein